MRTSGPPIKCRKHKSISVEVTKFQVANTSRQGAVLWTFLKNFPCRAVNTQGIIDQSMPRNYLQAETAEISSIPATIQESLAVTGESIESL